MKPEERFALLQKEFSDAGISTEEPGFYEEPGFIRREHKDPTYINNYAQFVASQNYSSAYMERATQAIHVIAEELQFALKLDPNEEALAEAPLVMSRMLEREGFWSFVMRGSLTVTAPPNLGFVPFSLWSVDKIGGVEKECGYQWLYAPPYDVVDILIQWPAYPYPVTQSLPKVVFGKDTETASYTPEELLSPAVLEQGKQAGESPEACLDRCLPNFRSRFAPDLPSRIVTRGDWQLKYTPTSIAVSEESLDHLTGFSCQGRTASQIHALKVRPRLSSPRAL
jgi:hypothetical protein